MRVVADLFFLKGKKSDTVKQLYCFCLTNEAMFLFLPDTAS